MSEVHLDNELIIGLAEKYGTPLYVYNGDLIVKRYGELHDFIDFPGLKILYAMKANYNYHILRLLEQKNASLDTVSPAEVLLALKAGYTADRILYTANNMTDEEMFFVKESEVMFNIDSCTRLEKYGRAFPGDEVCLRFNPDVMAGFHENVMTGGAITKFGILPGDVERVLDIVKKYDLTVVGLHEHTGSGLYDENKVYESMKNLLSIASPENFPHLRFIDFGGGFAVPYKPDDTKINYEKFGNNMNIIYTTFCSEYGRDLELYFEPGKYIVAESGYLLMEANTVKNNRGRLIVGTNSGFPQLIRPTYYGAYHQVVNLTNPHGEPKKYDVCGNICETGDVFAKQRELSEVREGDILAIRNAGAYCYSMGGVYNLRSMPAEVFCIEGKAALSRRRLSSSELVENILGECV